MSKKKHGHHGGAWKVAYADFVTAMMALFLVLWLTSQDEKIKEAVERSFKNPFMSLTKESTGLIPNKDVQAVKSSQGNFDSASAVELTMLRKISEEIMKSLDTLENSGDPAVKLETTSEGLRISVFDRTKRPIFERNSANFTEFGAWVFTTLAWQVGRFTNTFQVELEGHTEKTNLPETGDYGPWELTAERANAARRKLVENGLAPKQIRKIAGFGDTVPLPNKKPADEANRRVAVLLKVPSAKL